MTDTSAWEYLRTQHDGHVRQHLIRGDVHIVDATEDGISRAQLQGIADEVWALDQKWPRANPGPVTVTVRSSTDRGFAVEPDDDPAGYVAGVTGLFTAHIDINERTLTDTTPSSSSMPVAARVPAWTYTVAHEFGHAFTSRADADEGDGRRVSAEFFRQWWITNMASRDMSYYGGTNPMEGYAEAFAEWSLTDGATHNRAARSYARHYSWAK